MRESDIEELATHGGPEPCAVVCEGGGEASVGVRGSGRSARPGTRRLRTSAPVVSYRDCSYSAPSISSRLPTGCESATRTGVSGFGERIWKPSRGVTNMVRITSRSSS
jgi:hypothetical protein